MPKRNDPAPLDELMTNALNLHARLVGTSRELSSLADELRRVVSEIAAWRAEQMPTVDAKESRKVPS